MQDFIIGMKIYISYMLLGGAGGVAYQLLSKGSHAHASDNLRGAFVSGFTGLMAGLLATHWGLSLESAYLFSGLFGFVGGFGLLWIFALIMRRFNLSPTEVANLASTIQKSSGEKERTLPELLHTGILTRQQYDDIMRGDMQQLLKVHEENKISDAELIMILDWKYIVNHNEQVKESQHVLEDK